MSLPKHSVHMLKISLWLLLSVSFMLSTVPRCRAIDSISKDLLQFFAPVASKPLSCHQLAAAEASENGKASGTQLEEDRLCPCSLLTYLPLVLLEFDPEPWIEFRSASVRLLRFSLPQLLADYRAEPPVPYPKA